MPEKFPVFVAVKMTVEQAQALKRAAREDDRTLSGFLRRLIASALVRETQRPGDARRG